MCTNPGSINHFTFYFAMGLMMCLMLILCSHVWIHVLLWRMLFSVSLWSWSFIFHLLNLHAIKQCCCIYLNCLLFISLPFRFLFCHPPCHLISCFSDSSSLTLFVLCMLSFQTCTSPPLSLSQWFCWLFCCALVSNSCLSIHLLSFSIMSLHSS